jgi:hypothetical protein
LLEAFDGEEAENLGSERQPAGNPVQAISLKGAAATPAVAVNTFAK